MEQARVIAPDAWAVPACVPFAGASPAAWSCRQSCCQPCPACEPHLRMRCAMWWVGECLQPQVLCCICSADGGRGSSSSSSSSCAACVTRRSVEMSVHMCRVGEVQLFMCKRVRCVWVAQHWGARRGSVLWLSQKVRLPDSDDGVLGEAQRRVRASYASGTALGCLQT